MKKQKQDLKRILNLVKILAFSLVAIIIPFIIEAIVFEEKVFPFSVSIKISREGWFSFIASYIGALGTIFLGVLAIWQNKRYKDSSDKTDKEFHELQEKIRELVQTNTELTSINSDLQKNIKSVVDNIPDLIQHNSKIQEELCDITRTNINISESLLKIQKAIFYPRLINWNYYIMSENGMPSEMDVEHDAFENIIIGKYYLYSDEKNLFKIIKKDYSCIAFSLYNDSEKDIIAFKLQKIEIDGNIWDELYNSNMVNINAHQIIWCTFIFEKEFFREYIKKIRKYRSIKMYYSLRNTIGEIFILNCNFDVNGFQFNIDMIEKVDSLDTWYNKICKNTRLST